MYQVSGVLSWIGRACFAHTDQVIGSRRPVGPARSGHEHGSAEEIRPGRKAPEMEPMLTRPCREAIDHEHLLVHEWRVTQLTRLGIPWSLAQSAADHVDW